MASNETQYTRPDGYDILEASQAVTIRDYAPGEQFYLYGSAMRPMSASWARIPDAVFVNATQPYQGRKYHTFVVVPHQLDAATIASYELTVLVGPITWQPENEK